MNGRIVIATYKPKEGKAEALKSLMRAHLSILKSQGLVTERASIMMEAKDGTIIEVFEWKSKKVIENAHTNPVILEMWGKYAEVCDYIPISQVKETASMFAEFTPFV